MQGCDTLLMVGTGLVGIPAQGRGRPRRSDRHRSLDAVVAVASRRQPAWRCAAATLKALLPLIRYKDEREWSKTIEANVTAWWKKLEGRAKAEANPVNPQRVVWEMSPLLPANAIVTSDSGSCANWLPATSGNE
jgi:pyruvate dehydrogenase (quinone)